MTIDDIKNCILIQEELNHKAEKLYFLNMKKK
jgi:hypothetical protein